MEIWGEKTTICMRVNPHYIYWVKVSNIGIPTDNPGGLSMWSWVNHLREKVWWSDEVERSFMKIAYEMYEK